MWYDLCIIKTGVDIFVDISAFSLKLRGLSVLRGVLSEPFISAFSDTLSALYSNAPDFASKYGILCSEFYSRKGASNTVLEAVHANLNPLNSDSVKIDALLSAATKDIETLNTMLSLDSTSIKTAARDAFSEPALMELPDFPASPPLPFLNAEELMGFYHKNGFGFFAKANAFTVVENGRPEPVTRPDPVSLSDLPGYVRQKKQIIQNTLAFLDGREANNILLYGDKGTGKSSTVKAVANACFDKGLKIIDLPPRYIRFSPKVFDEVKQSPFRFLLFLDDLSFSNEDENFAALKAFIEGGLSDRPSNLLIYATSNRRHLIKEMMSDRQGDEVRVRDTLETAASLSDRFGLEITFSVPDPDEYLFITKKLAADAGINLCDSELKLLAERFALRRSGRSPRAAKQFIRQLIAERYSNQEPFGIR